MQRLTTPSLIPSSVGPQLRDKIANGPSRLCRVGEFRGGDGAERSRGRGGGGGGQGARLEPGGARNGIGFRLAAAPHATARARLHAGYSARAIARSAARYRALHRAGLFSLPSAAARARSPPYHCSCGPAFN
jgi:hypothetical protein